MTPARITLRSSRNILFARPSKAGIASRNDFSMVEGATTQDPPMPGKQETEKPVGYSVCRVFAAGILTAMYWPSQPCAGLNDFHNPMQYCQADGCTQRPECPVLRGFFPRMCAALQPGRKTHFLEGANPVLSQPQAELAGASSTRRNRGVKTPQLHRSLLSISIHTSYLS